MNASPKYFILDTNVLLHSPSCVTKFLGNVVVIPVDVIEELDKFKQTNDELGRNARAVIRIIDDARAQGSLADGGAPINEHGGKVMIDMKPLCLLEHGLRSDLPDNRILSVAYRHQREGKRAILVSKDANMRVKCDALGIPCEDFETDKVPAPDDLYAGWRSHEVPEEALSTLSRERELELSIAGLNPNEAVLLREDGNPKRTVLARPKRKNGASVTLKPFDTGQESFMGLSPRNLEQRIALELLTDPSVNLVTLIGQAGTGKTLLALAAGLHLTLRKHAYEKLLVARPIMPLGRDIGYLPGSAEEKLMPWMKPIFDNMKFILREKREPGEAEKKMLELFKSGVVEIEPLTFIRGRSIHGHFVIVDEVQNLTPHQVKTIISRVGHDTKLVLTGDPYQIDNPYLDSRSNGLTYVAERFKGQEVAGHVLFTRSERSKLASIAVEIL
jgi:PhoH-like ATPase